MNFLSSLFKPTPRRIRVRTHDTLLTAERAKPADLGARYVGDLQPVGEALAGLVRALGRIADTAQRKRVAAAITRDMSEYGSQLASSTASRGPAGSLMFSERPPEFKLDREPDLGADPVFDDDPYIGMGASPTSINDANAKLWSGKAKDSAARVKPLPSTTTLSRRVADAKSVPAQVIAINDLNRQFYGR